MPEKVEPSQTTRLLERIAALEAENADLKRRLAFLEESPMIAAGIRGEQLVASLVGGELTRFADRVDVVLPDRAMSIEVKYSNLNHAVAHSVTKRWSWRDLFGRDRGKRYDRLILVGDADERFTEHYRDPGAPFVIFDLSHDEAEHLFPEYGALQVSTNPLTARSPQARALFDQYQITKAELAARYRDRDSR